MRIFMRMLLLRSAYRRKQTNLKNTNKSRSMSSFQGPQSSDVSCNDVLTLDLGHSPRVADIETGPELSSPPRGTQVVQVDSELETGFQVRSSLLIPTGRGSLRSWDHLLTPPSPPCQKEALSLGLASG